MTFRCGRDRKVGLVIRESGRITKSAQRAVTARLSDGRDKMLV